MLFEEIKKSNSVKSNLVYIEKDINKAIEKISSIIKNKGKLLFCGNGGSAADAQHMTAEMLIKLRTNIIRNPIPAMSLAMDTSTITACGNDFDFKNIFLRPFQALADKKDLLFCFSTSGNSQNIIRVLKEAKKRKIYSISLLGNYGGLAKKYTNLPLIVKSNDTANIQETHVFLSHYILKNVEDRVIKAFRK
tara:strand:+ start:73 stop:648 length:576 start_codon:yes stop_codon:yes gene_type:complete